MKLFTKMIRRKVHVRGYVDPDIQDVQQLCYGTKRFHVVVDEEIVPSDIITSLGAFGDTGRTDWKSKFQPWIPKKRGGTMEDYA